MINIIRKFFERQNKVKPKEITELAKSIEPVIDKTANEVFKKYYKTLLNEKNTYIVFAVWDAKRDGELTPEQKEINSKVISTINVVSKIFNIRELNDSQEYAIGYLIRGLFISKINYMIEFMKNKMSNVKSEINEKYDFSDNTIPNVNECIDNLNECDSSFLFRKPGNNDSKRW